MGGVSAGIDRDSQVGEQVDAPEGHRANEMLLVGPRHPSVHELLAYIMGLASSNLWRDSYTSFTGEVGCRIEKVS